MKYKLLAIDLDGTLLSDQKTISPGNCFWLKKAEDAGIKVALATGRGMPKVEDFMKELDMDLALVLTNGAEVWASPSRLLERHLLSEEIVRKLHRLAQENMARYWGYSVNELIRQRVWHNRMFEKQWLKFGIRHEDLDVISNLRDVVRSWETVEVTYAAPNNMEVSAKGVTKASGIARLCKYFGFKMSDVLAIGDSHNDSPLMKSAGFSVAMGNAEQQIKDLADAVTLSENKNGVAHAICHYVFGMEHESLHNLS